MTTRTIKPGARVRYSAEWLRSTGQFTGPVPFRRGTVERVYQSNGAPGVRMVEVRWDDREDWGRKVLAANLEVTK